MGEGALDQFREALQQDLREKGFAERAVIHATLPVNTGDMPVYNGFAISFNSNGATMALWLNVVDGTIERASFTADGDMGLTACGSMLTEMLKGKTLEQARALEPRDIMEELGGLPPGEKPNADLAIEVLGMAIADYEG